MVRPWSVSFSGLLLWFLSLQLGLFDTNASQVWDLDTKYINSRLKLGGSPCALVYKKFRITCFPKVQHFVGQGLTFDSSKDLSFHPTEWQRFGTRWFTAAEDSVLMLWGWSIPLQLHISTWKTHGLNYILWTEVWWDSLYLLLSYRWCSQPMGLTWSLWQVTVLHWYHWTTERHHSKQETVWKLSQKETFSICLQ